jgi:hypothetical protein
VAAKGVSENSPTIKKRPFKQTNFKVIVPQQKFKQGMLAPHGPEGSHPFPNRDYIKQEGILACLAKRLGLSHFT